MSCWDGAERLSLNPTTFLLTFSDAKEGPGLSLCATTSSNLPNV